MPKKRPENTFIATNTLKVLSYIVDNPGEEFLCGEIQKATSISRAGVYLAVKDLEKAGFISKCKKGKQLFYTASYNDPVIKQFKVLKNVIGLRSLVSKLKDSCKSIRLYGSASRGENDPKSDIDLFILTQSPEEVKETIISMGMRFKIQAVIKTPAEFSEQKEKESVYYREVDRGITLWEDMS
jgi:predicted nucleotidyltransferase